MHAARPPSTEASDADNLAQTSKRRMPPEIKPKLAKIARLAVLRLANMTIIIFR